MAVFASDTFAGTDGALIAGRTDDLGNSWAEHAGDSAGEWVIQTNRARQQAAGTALVYNSGTPAGAEYDVEASILAVNTSSAAPMCLAARIDSSTRTHYEAGHTTTGTDGWIIGKYVAGTYTELTRVAEPAPFVTGNAYAWKFEVRNGTKKLIVDGVEKASSTDNGITAAGKVGFRAGQSGSSGGPRIDTFSATDAATGGGGTFTASGSGTAASATGAGAGLGSTVPSFTASGSATAADATGSGVGLASLAPSSTLGGAGTSGPASGSGAGLRYTSLSTLGGSSAGDSATSTGAGLTSTVPIFGLIGAAAPDAAGGSGLGIVTTTTSALSGAGTAGPGDGSGTGLHVANPIWALSGAASAGVQAGSGAGLRVLAPGDLGSYGAAIGTLAINDGRLAVDTNVGGLAIGANWGDIDFRL